MQEPVSKERLINLQCIPKSTTKATLSGELSEENMASESQRNLINMVCSNQLRKPILRKRKKRKTTVLPRQDNPASSMRVGSRAIKIFTQVLVKGEQTFRGGKRAIIMCVMATNPLRSSG